MKIHYQALEDLVTKVSVMEASQLLQVNSERFSFISFSDTQGVLTDLQMTCKKNIPQ